MCDGYKIEFYKLLFITNKLRMKKILIAKKITLLLLLMNFSFIKAQGIETLQLNAAEGLRITFIKWDKGFVDFSDLYPLLSLEINDELISTLEASSAEANGQFYFNFSNGIKATVTPQPDVADDYKLTVVFKNTNKTDTIDIANVVPFGQSDDHLYITASGPWSLTRAKIFRPGKTPVDIMLPDNVWELGYSSIELESGYSVCSFARRVDYKDAQRGRWKTRLYPGGSVTYDIYTDVFKGEWQNGLRLMFRDRYLHDLEEFDNSLFEREDLKWIRDKYTILLVMAWDKRFYDRNNLQYTYQSLLNEGKEYFGGYDVFSIWPTWPTLGLDPRNQWDMHADLPGGLKALKNISNDCKAQGTKYFAVYNPWDLSTRSEDPHEGLYKLIKSTNADGVVIDTRGKSSYELQEAADRAKSGVVMYSEGMAVIKDMPGIVSGRAHNAIYMQPMLNLNRLIKPEFSIFRVIDVGEDTFQREVSVSFFNGYGNELNMYNSPRPSYIHEDFLYMGKLTKLLKDNSTVFRNKNWEPLIETRVDNIWVNKWFDNSKTIYTIFSLIPEGFNNPLFEIEPDDETHYVDLYNHTEIVPDTLDGKLYVGAEIESFPEYDLETRKESRVGCIAEFPSLLTYQLQNDNLYFSADKGNKIIVWAGDPSYQNDMKKEFSIQSHDIKLYDLFSDYTGKIVIQLFENKNLLDEGVINVTPGLPRLKSEKEQTELAMSTPQGMIEIPAGEYSFKITHGSEFIQYPDYKTPIEVQVSRFYIDKYPVTNQQYKEFLEATNYVPKDTANFLQHWADGNIRAGEENYPVVNVSIEDAKAYAKWAGKRLPTQIEWQYAAQAGDTSNTYPWGSEFDSTKCNNGIGKPTPVDQFPEGANKYGVMDLVGNVWQLTNDIYNTDGYDYIIIKGGSYFKPTASWWYVQGGPQPLTHIQRLLMVSPGFERNATVGFRCVKDAK